MFPDFFLGCSKLSFKGNLSVERVETQEYSTVSLLVGYVTRTVNLLWHMYCKYKLSNAAFPQFTCFTSVFTKICVIYRLVLSFARSKPLVHRWTTDTFRPVCLADRTSSLKDGGHYWLYIRACVYFALSLQTMTSDMVTASWRSRSSTAIRISLEALWRPTRWPQADARVRVLRSGSQEVLW